MKKVKEAQAQLGQLNAELAEHNKTAADLDNDIASILSDMQKAKSEHRTMKQQALEKKDEMDNSFLLWMNEREKMYRSLL